MRAHSLYSFGASLLALAVPSSLAQQTCAFGDVALNPISRNQWGQATAISDQFVAASVPGSPGDPAWGAIFLFEQSGNRMNAIAALRPFNAVPPTCFGTALAMNDSLVAVGAYCEVHEPEIDGTVYVYDRIGPLTWNQGTRLIANQADADPGRNEYFGCAVALDATTIAIGAYYDGPDGSAYVFDRDETGTWLQTARLTPADPLAWYFGYSVAILGDTILVGSPNDFQMGNYAGSAYVFNRDSNGNWRQTAKLLPDPGHIQVCGWSVALLDSSALVCAPAAIGGRGGVYVFNRELDGDWAPGGFLRPRNPNDFSAFGSSVAVFGNRALIGASANNGVAFVFERNPDGEWREIAQLTAPGGGYSVALGEHLGIVGAPFYDLHGENSGAAYVFAVGPDSDDNGVMDVCECRAAGDLTLDGAVDFQDLILVLSSFALDEGGDLNADGVTDLQDLANLLANFGTACP